MRRFKKFVYLVVNIGLKRSGSFFLKTPILILTCTVNVSFYSNLMIICRILSFLCEFAVYYKNKHICH
jgi:hypothetical protein